MMQQYLLIRNIAIALAKSAQLAGIFPSAFRFYVYMRGELILVSD
jgi:hypothetical protein